MKGEMEMETREGYFPGRGEKNLFYRGWIPDSMQGMLAIVHGFGEHSNRYSNVVEKLVPNGFGVFAHDHRGHGKSQGIRTHVESFMDYIEDSHHFIDDIVRPAAAEKPLFLLGHSMGSLIAMHYLPLYGENLKGCVLSGTGAFSTTGGPLLRMAARGASRVVPRLRLDFPMKSCFISRDWEVVRQYDEDPLVEKTLSCRLGEQMMTYMGKILEQAGRITLPVLIQCGEKDESFTGAEKLFEALASDDKTLKIYPGCKHEMYNELPKEREKALADLLEWLKARA